MRRSSLSAFPLVLWFLQAPPLIRAQSAVGEKIPVSQGEKTEPVGSVPDPANTERWLKWASVVSKDVVSPVAAQPGDHQIAWVGPNGKKISVTVRLPHPVSKAPSVSVENVAEGVDAAPAFAKAVEQARTVKAGRLVIPPGRYVFKSATEAHWVLSDLNDVTVEGNGATLVFTSTNTGIAVRRSHRLAIKDLNLTSTLHTATLGTVIAQGSENVLKVDSDFPVTEADSIGHISEYDRTSRLPVPAGIRLYYPPGSKQMPRLTNEQTYTSAGFQNKNMVGKSFLIFHHWYSGSVIEIKDSADDAVGPNASEDIVISNVHILSGPGMGIVAFGLKRGLGIWNSSIAPAPGGLISTEYDAIHTLMLRGDVSIHDNTILRQGDDAINLNNSVTPIEKIDASGTDMILATQSRFIKQHDQITAFDESNRVLGAAQVMDVPQFLGGPSNQWYRFKLSQVIPGLTPKSLFRDNEIASSRVAIVHNTIGSCGCHGILVQVPNVLIAENTISHTSGNAIRLITNVGVFKEGTGAINVLVRDNVITASGQDLSVRNVKFAAIAAYGAGHDGVLSSASNAYIDITGNTIKDAAQGCLTVQSSIFVRLVENSCINTNLATTSHNQPSIYVSQSANVLLRGNRKVGPALMGNIFIDKTTTESVSGQNSY